MSHAAAPSRPALMVVTGKGGVGKSTVAAALGLAAARRGRRTIVAEVAGRADAARLIGVRSAPASVERRSPAGPFAVSIDADRALEEYLREQLPRVLADTLAHSRVFRPLAAAAPGLRELVTIGQVWELAQRPRLARRARPYDLVVLDAPATGHALALLGAPRMWAGVARTGRVARQAADVDAFLRDPARGPRSSPSRRRRRWRSTRC